MSPQYPQGSDDFRDLAPDDIAGICAIYQQGRTTTSDVCEPRHGFSEACGTTEKPGGCCTVAPGGASRSSPYALAAGIAGFALFFWRRRRV
jgi:MYXO-CTERM domain-containing protein